MTEYRNRMDDLIDKCHGYVDLMELAPAFRGFRARTTADDLEYVADRLDKLAAEIRLTKEAYEKRLIGRTEAEQRIDAYIASRKPAEVQ